MFKPNPNDTLSKFVQERGLSQADQALIEKFVTLDSSSRQAVVDYVLSIADAIMGLEPSTAPQGRLPESVSKPAALEPEDAPDPDIERQVERYRQHLIAKAKAEAKASTRRAPDEMTREELHAELDRQLDAEEGIQSTTSAFGSGKSDTVAG